MVLLLKYHRRFIIVMKSLEAKGNAHLFELIRYSRSCWPERPGTPECIFHPAFPWAPVGGSVLTEPVGPIEGACLSACVSAALFCRDARIRSVNTHKPAALKCAPGAHNKYESVARSALPPADSAEIYGSVKDPYFHGSMPAGMPMRP